MKTSSRHVLKMSWRRLQDQQMFAGYEVGTVLIETEHTLNSHPLTYMSDENYTESVTPLHLLYGRDITRKNSDINYFTELSEASNAWRQLSNLQQIISHINKRFYNEYFLVLRESDINTIVKVILIFKTFPLVIQYSWKMSIYLIFVGRKKPKWWPCQRSIFRHCCINYKQNAMYSQQTFVGLEDVFNTYSA